MDENTLHEILNEVDLNKNGQVELNEFLQVSCVRGNKYICFLSFGSEWLFENGFLSPQGRHFILEKKKKKKA